ncbi:MAG: RNA polymerase subunit sigma, partial [Labilithrix sp.]|nr:RNA polymerase subunit sigma [Labilithrix sp.]
APARAALARLKPTEREAVVLCLVGGLEAADVAAACGVDLGTAKTRIARGVEQLLQQEAPDDGEGGAR